MRQKHVLLVLTLALSASTAVVEAVPIVYSGTLASNVPASGVNTQDPFLFDEPVGADYWQFFAPAGATVLVDGRRTSGDYDMALWVFAGIFTDTTQFAGPFDLFTPGFVAKFDDEAPPNVPGPFGDPRGSFVASAGGFYTIAVTNNLSSANPPNLYALTVTAVPEPAAMTLLSVGLLCASRRLRARR